MEFFLDENVLGLAAFLEHHVKFRKVGDPDCPGPVAPDTEIVKFAKDNNLVIVTKDKRVVNQCIGADVKYLTNESEVDFAKRIIDYQSK